MNSAEYLNIKYTEDQFVIIVEICGNDKPKMNLKITTAKLLQKN